jgi:hypothetical protein
MAEFFNRIGPNRTFVPAAANGRSEPTSTDAARRTNVGFSELCNTWQKPVLPDRVSGAVSV